MESEELKNIRMNLWQIVNELKLSNQIHQKMNWNFGRIVAALENNPELSKKIKEAQDLIG